MNVELLYEDGTTRRVTGVGHFEQGADGVGVFDSRDRGVIIQETVVRYGGPANTGDLPRERIVTIEELIESALRAERGLDDGQRMVVRSAVHDVPAEEEIGSGADASAGSATSQSSGESPS